MIFFRLNLTLGALDNLFNLLFRVGIFVHCVDCMTSPYITHSWSVVPYDHQAPRPSPVAPLIIYPHAPGIHS